LVLAYPADDARPRGDGGLGRIVAAGEHHQMRVRRRIAQADQQGGGRVGRRLHLDGDDMWSRSADVLTQVRRVRGGVAGHQNIGHGGQAGGQRFGEKVLIIYQEGT